jgi:lysophospholipase L1-like esterase
MLSGRYVDQTITMVNEGYPGRFAKDDTGRFKDVMAADRPEVVLLMHGANDLLNFKEDAIPGVLSALEDMIHESKRDGAVVFLATLPPQNPAGSRGGGAAALPDLNAGIRATAADEGVTLVDLYAQMGTYVGYIGVDGLHPTTAGYTKIAQIWRDAIEAQLELPPATPASITAPRAPVRTIRPTR